MPRSPITALTRTFAGTAAAAALIAGCLAGAGTSYADAPAPVAHTAVSARTTAPRAVVNLGLSLAEAKNVQCYLHYNSDYTGAWDGQLGTQSWESFQLYLRSFGYTGAIDGIVGGGTVAALQHFLSYYGYTGAFDGIAGPGTQTAFKVFADGLSC